MPMLQVAERCTEEPTVYTTKSDRKSKSASDSCRGHDLVFDRGVGCCAVDAQRHAAAAAPTPSAAAAAKVSTIGKEPL